MNVGTPVRVWLTCLRHPSGVRWGRVMAVNGDLVLVEDTNGKEWWFHRVYLRRLT